MTSGLRIRVPTRGLHTSRPTEGRDNGKKVLRYKILVYEFSRRVRVLGSGKLTMRAHCRVLHRQRIKLPPRVRDPRGYILLLARDISHEGRNRRSFASKSIDRNAPSVGDRIADANRRVSPRIGPIDNDDGRPNCNVRPRNNTLTVKLTVFSIPGSVWSAIES